MKIFAILFLHLCTCVGYAFSLSISKQDANQIAERIWKNECAGSIEGLTHWKKGENFPSLGIGHFIWYAPNKKERFQETFPELLGFLQESGSTLPAWLEETEGCPWTSREDFYAHIKSSKMESLRQMLYDTKDLQAIFIAKRLEKSLPKMIENLPQEEKTKVTYAFNRLSESPRGLFALMDYVNFKGEGTSSAETYNGQGWGLLQVLQGIPSDSNSTEIVDSFMKSAKDTLEQRVKNSPPERNEKQWLKGWLNRVDNY